MSSEDRLLEILGSWREHRGRGDEIDPESLVAEHPEFADELRACFATLEALDEVIAEARIVPASVLAQLSDDGEPLRPVVLQDPDRQDATTPLLRPDTSDTPGFEGRYQVVGEIARGGVGVVLKGHDLDLGRSVAMKVILKEHQANPDIIRRFVEEAQIGGQLQHPGIVPVYEIGLRKDKRPYFTMKLIKGQTLAALIAERKDPAEERQHFLSIFESVCQTVAYAHARGVVHRDLKPANVMVGAFGEVLVVDWGMGKVLRRGGVDDERRSVARQDLSVIHTVRTENVGSASELGSVIGTLRYMPPEQARGDLDRVDERSDVFALGATLCEILTGDPPYTGTDRQTLYRQALDARLEDALGRLEHCGADPELIRLATVCLSAHPLDRPRNAGEVAKAVRRHLSEVEERAERARTQAAQERLRAEHARRARRAGALALAVTVVVGVVVVTLIENRRLEAQRARAATQKALDSVLRLSDAKKARDLVDETDGLWPIRSDRAPAMEDWLRRARILVTKRPDHEAALEEVRLRALPYTAAEQEEDRRRVKEEIETIERRVDAIDREAEGLSDMDDAERRAALAAQARELQTERARVARRLGQRTRWQFATAEDAWRHQVLADLLDDLRELEGAADDGWIAGIQRRYEASSSLRERSVESQAEAWARAIEGIRTSDRYDGLTLAPLEGLVPLGPDPDSGLYEFAHVGSGSIPTRASDTGRLEYAEDAAIVLVLIPGGVDLLGAQSTNPAEPNYDPHARLREGPVHEVTLSPYLLGKHEVTQAQWAALTAGLRPSYFAAGQVCVGKLITDRNPVECVSWTDCRVWFARNRLVLPTEAQWEYACRAGTDAAWSGDLAHSANIADAYLQAHGGTDIGPCTYTVNDGHGVHAPVGSFAPNPFGLFDTYGNVWEWCRDDYAVYEEGSFVDPVVQMPVSLGHVCRGGSWKDPVEAARSSRRAALPTGFRSNPRGVRAAVSLPRP